MFVFVESMSINLTCLASVAGFNVDISYMFCVGNNISNVEEEMVYVADCHDR